MNKEMTVRIICSALLIAVFLLYPWLNKRAANAHIIKLWIDDWIPLVPIFSIPYILYIPFLAITLGYFVLFTELYQAISLSFIFCIGVASIIYFFYQTTVPRPEITGTDVFSKMVLYIYSKDHPYNCFPSLHTALSVLSFLYWIQVFPNLKWSMGAFVLSILISTVTLKQHYIPDVISGILLAIASLYVANFIVGSRMF
jgi:membrane-associated phospholipid phosphatase